jgi:DNA-binding PadR family transcriptional regulator
MSQVEKQKVKLGKKEKAVLDFLKSYPQGIWKDEVIRHFSWASKYDGVMSKRLHNLQKKGLIIIKSEINPETGRSKQRVYLKQ